MWQQGRLSSRIRGVMDAIWHWPDRRLEHQLRQNAEWCRQAREALPLSAYYDWLSGDSDATD